jgi:hypothetical protein
MNGSRSHDPESTNFNMNIVKQGRNQAPKKGDDSVLNTRADTVFNEPAQPDSTPPSDAPVLSAALENNATKHVSRHAELKARGDAKKKLLASLLPRTGPTLARTKDTKSAAPKLPEKRKFVISSTIGDLPIDGDGVKSKKAKKQIQELEEENGDADPKFKNSERKREKNRDRVHAKKEKERVKQSEKLKKNQKEISNKPKFNEVIDRPSLTVKELGEALSKKLGKHSKIYQNAYDKIQKNPVS